MTKLTILANSIRGINLTAVAMNKQRALASMSENATGQFCGIQTQNAGWCFWSFIMYIMRLSPILHPALCLNAIPTHIPEDE